MEEGTRAQTGGINKIEEGEGVECCVFLSLKNMSILSGTCRVLHTHTNPAPTTQASCAFGQTLGEGVRARRGGLTRLKAEKGLSVVSFCH